jgi:hypothetical protein
MYFLVLVPHDRLDRVKKCKLTGYQNTADSVPHDMILKRTICNPIFRLLDNDFASGFLKTKTNRSGQISDFCLLPDIFAG